MPDGKKRPRKRSRKSKGDGPGNGDDVETEPVALQTAERVEPPADADAYVDDFASNQHIRHPANEPEPTSKASFYERTNPHKPSVLPRPSDQGGRKYTLSIALPGSIVRNAQTQELRSLLAGQIARTCAIFNVDEIVVFDEGENPNEAAASGLRNMSWKGKGTEDGDDSAGEGGFDTGSFLARILQYLETPQYLRKSLFPMHRDLRLAGLLPPLDCPHHLRFEDESPYREGVTVDAPSWTGGAGKKPKGASTTWVNVGLRDPIEAEFTGGDVQAGMRVTVKMPPHGRGHGRLVSPRQPVEQKGLYWGYSVRFCASLAQVLTECPWSRTSRTGGAAESSDGNMGYDLVIGTSERGTSLTDILNATNAQQTVGSASPLPAFDHVLVMFGGLSGLEVAVERDRGIQLGAEDAHDLCDAWVNVVEGQGSRTVRTEEALMITLSRLKATLETLGRR